jgi:hypothetical protein
MNMAIEKSGGFALLTGSLLMLSTMVLHPEGGNLQQLLKVARIIVISHSMALLAVPLLGVGFWGLTKRMGVNHFLPLLSFAMMITGLLAGMMAATINGLALPIFIQNFQVATAETAISIKPILRNNMALNQAFDYVFLSAVSLSILFWSITILTLKNLPLWIGYFGLLLSLTAIALLISGFVFVNLHGFRLFVLSNVVWISLVGIALIRLTLVKKNNSLTGV